MSAWLHRFTGKDDQDYKYPEVAPVGQAEDTGVPKPSIFEVSDVDDTEQFGDGKRTDGSSTSKEESDNKKTEKAVKEGEQYLYDFNKPERDQIQMRQKII